MKHLLVFAHPRRISLNRAILERTEHVLESMGHSVQVRDLYKIGFDPVLTEEDFSSMGRGQIPEDIKKEQDFVAAADVITLIYPVWWAGMPAIMKGYIDRVLAYGFAYAYTPQGELQSLLAGKKGWIINTQGEAEEIYRKNGMSRSIDQAAEEGIFDFTGISPLGRLCFGSVQDAGEEQGKKILDELEKKIRGLF